MVALIIILGLILLIAFLLSFHLRAEIKFYGGKLEFKVKYMFFNLYPLKEKKAKPKKKRKRKRKRKSKRNKRKDKNTEIAMQDKHNSTADETVQTDDENAPNELSDEDKKLLSGEDDDKKEDKEKKKLSEKIDRIVDVIQKVKILWDSAEKGMRKVLKSIRLDDLVIDFVIAADDAYDAAMLYGKISAVVYNAISLVRLFVPISVKTVDVICDFDRKECVFDGECKIKMRLSTLVHGGFCILIALLKNWTIIKEMIDGKNAPEKDAE